MGMSNVMEPNNIGLNLVAKNVAKILNGDTKIFYVMTKKAVIWEFCHAEESHNVQSKSEIWISIFSCSFAIINLHIRFQNFGKKCDLVIKHTIFNLFFIALYFELSKM